MPRAVSLISTLAAGFGLALLFGFIAERLRLPALIGYLVAGIVIGPATPGFVADAEIAAQLAEIGLMLLMFGVGLHFSLDDLLAVRKVALSGAVVQMGAATALGAGMALLWGWPLGAALVLGLSLSVASTVGLLKALEARGELESGGVPFVVAEENRELVEQLRADGIPAVFGTATEAAVLIQAHIATARMLVIATPETIEVGRMAEAARTLNPAIEIAVRSHNAEEAGLLESEWRARVFVGESALAAAMVAHVLQTVAPDAPHAASQHP